MCIKQYNVFFDGYKKFLYEGLIQTINSLEHHDKYFLIWLKKLSYFSL